MSIRGLAAALNASGRFKYKPPEYAVDHLIIGGGVVGLAIAEKLSRLYPRKSTYVVERHPRAGEETSSRNSEVIHAGIYYPPGSLKERLCVLGRQSLYQRCLDRNIPHRRVGKLIVAHDHQREYLYRLVKKIHQISSSSRDMPTVPVELISGTEALEMLPDLSPDIAFALHSPETGIVDSHALMESFEKDIGESETGELVYSTRVVRVDPYSPTGPPARETPDGTSQGWVVQTVTSSADGHAETKAEGDSLLARVLINASGLNANLVLNSLLPPDRAIPMYYARGSYASYRGPGVKGISKLVYPVPDTSSGRTAEDSFKFQSLGTHLTVDMEGNIRFGPDIEWLSPPSSGSHDGSTVVDESAIDFWARHLVADDNIDKLQAMHRAITTYLPNVALEGLKPDYVGVRPKLVGPGGGFQDFHVRFDRTVDFGGSGGAPMVSLLGIESPGLTASLAIAEFVADKLENL